jgi:hypothetical protein
VRMADPHGDREIAIFQEFARDCRLSIANIEKRQPPEPDILCDVADIGKVAFEMVESIDPGLAQQMDNAITKSVQAYYESLPDPEHNEIKDLLSGCLLRIGYLSLVNKRQKRRAMETLFDQLRTLGESGFRGAFRPEEGDPAFGVVSMIRIHDAFSEGGGPSFDEGDAISIDDPSDSVIQGKFGKT